MSNAIAIDCSACKSDSTMKPTKVSRFNTVLRLIGYIIVVPSVLGVAFSFLTCFATADAASQVMAEAQSEAETAGATLGAGIGYTVSLFIGAGSLVGGLVGYLLLLKRKVFRCFGCGYILDRA